MATSTAEQTCASSARLPTAQETFVLHQRCVKLVDRDLCQEIAICPYLVGRLTFEPWVEFEEHVQRTAHVVKEALSKDKSSLETVQCVLGRAWTKVDKRPLGSRLHTESLFPVLFDVVRPVMKIINDQAPPLACADRIILPHSKIAKPQGLLAKNCVMIDERDWDARIPCLGVTSSGPNNCLYDGEKRMEPFVPRRATEISESWNVRMSKLPDFGDFETADHQLWILNAVTQALYSHSGCAVVWNYRSMVALQIMCPADDGKSGDDQIRVQVSGMYTDVEGENATFGVISALQVGLKSALSSARSAFLKFSGEILSKSSPRILRTNDELFSTGSSKWLEESRSAVLEDETIPTEEYCWISNRAAALFESSYGECKDKGSLAHMFFEHVLTNYSHVLYASEDTSVLLYGSIGNVPIVVKYANTNMSAGSELLQNEVGIYEFLRKEHAEALGSCVPDLLGMRIQRSCDPVMVLVLEYVGQCVTWSGGGPKVGGLPITDGDWKQIIDAATCALHMLSKIGIWHSDEYLGNIRVERIAESTPERKGEMGSEGRWRVWWIDFGLAQKRTGTRKPKQKWYEENSFCTECLTIYTSKLELYS